MLNITIRLFVAEVNKVTSGLEGFHGGSVQIQVKALVLVRLSRESAAAFERLLLLHRVFFCNLYSLD